MATPSPRQTARHLQRLGFGDASLAIVLGSGFRQATQNLEVRIRKPYSELPGFIPPAVAGHTGEIMQGSWQGVSVLVLCGRSHYYEGHSMEAITFPIRVLAELGLRAVLLTNAAGGIRRGFQPGEFMAIEDHLNFMGASPLRGPEQPGRPRFVDLSACYDPGLLELWRKASRLARVKVHRGVYLAVSGPSYETPAEIRAFSRWGADAVGMSTVPEAVVARQCGLRVAGLSCLTNLAAGLGGAISHQEVLDQASRIGGAAGRLLAAFTHLYASHTA